MKNKLFITAAFILFSGCIQAQDKYQFMVIQYQYIKPTLFISLDGEQYVEEKVEKPKTDLSINPLLKKVKEYQNKDWEVMSFNNNNATVNAYLRKKIETK